MKVNIGKYPTNHITSNLFSDYMTKKYGYVNWPVKYTKFEIALEEIDDFMQIVYDKTINKIISRRKRKINVRIDPYDTWNMDNTLAHIILPMLKKLKETKHGAPLVDDEDVPENLRSTSAPPKKNEWDTDDNHFARWDYVLDEMIYTFECGVDDDWEDQFHSGKYDLDSVSYNKAMTRRNNSMRLFGKYYGSLWD
jgi:hypothetical protein